MSKTRKHMNVTALIHIPSLMLVLGLCLPGAALVQDDSSCGDPGAGSCWEENDSPGCDCAPCCEVVCALDEACCEVEWDQLCSIYASNLPACDDCNENGVPDGCDIADGFSEDCNGNGVPDECDIPDGTIQDCNGNGVRDECDISDGTSFDCNLNGVPDECDNPDGTIQDCNENDVPDECDIAYGDSDDCDENGVPDECDIADCNGNGLPDRAEGPTFCPESSVIPVDLVVIADPSGSNGQMLSVLCDDVFTVAVDMLSPTFDVRLAWVRVEWGGSTEAPLTECHDWTMPRGTPVPTCGAVETRFIDDDDGEEWGDASAVMTTPYDHLDAWEERDAVLILIPISDEGPQNGNGGPACGCEARSSVSNLIQQAWIENVQVVPMATEGIGSCVFKPADPAGLMNQVAAETGGSVVDARAWSSSKVLAGELAAAIQAAVAESPRVECVDCPADINGDGEVGGPDLAILLAAWGLEGDRLPADLNGDGVIGGFDLASLLSKWDVSGPCP